MVFFIVLSLVVVLLLLALRRYRVNARASTSCVNARCSVSLSACLLLAPGDAGQRIFRLSWSGDGLRCSAANISGCQALVNVFRGVCSVLSTVSDGVASICVANGQKGD
jgi:hypothetical protein